MWFAAYAALVSIGALNRETTFILLCAVYLVTKRDFRGFAALLCLGGAIYAGVRLSIGERPVALTVLETFRDNISPLRLVQTLLLSLTFIPVALAAFAQRRAAPSRGLLPVALLYAGMVAVGALWHEVRLWLPALLLVMPVVLANEKRPV